MKQRFPYPALLLAIFSLFLSAAARGQCPGTDDSFEDNDTCATPWPISPGVYPNLYTEKSTLDSDYFEITVPTDRVVMVAITFSNAAADTELALYDAGCSHLLDLSATTEDTERVFFNNTTGSPVNVTAHAFVYKNAVRDCNRYTLEVHIFPDPCPSASDDALEDNDDCASALSGVTGFFPDLFVSKTDFDYYAYTLAVGERIDVDAFFSHLRGDVDLLLYDASNCGGGVDNSLAKGDSTDSREHLKYENSTGAPQDVVLEVKIWGGSGLDCNVYDLSVSLSGAPGPIGTNYCSPANVNSSGLPGVISAYGLTDVAKNYVRLDAAQLPLQQFGMFLNSMATGAVIPPGSQGVLCLSGGIGRHSQNLLNTGSSGRFALTLDLQAIPTPGGNVAIQPGETWYWQAWVRDQNPMPTSNFTDGIGILFQ